MSGLVCGYIRSIIYLSPFFDSGPARQGWHDKIGKTMVIKTR